MGIPPREIDLPSQQMLALWRFRSRPGLPAAAGVAFAAQFLVCRILIGGYYGVLMLRAVLSLQPPQVSPGASLKPKDAHMWLLPVRNNTALS